MSIGKILIKCPGRAFNPFPFICYLDKKQTRPVLRFFRIIRKRLLTQNRLGRYLLYALGEIILVVLGILIAIQINEWNRGRDLYQQELESYQLIVADLKRDSALFKTYETYYSGYLDSYFGLNRLQKGQGSFDSILPDPLVMNIEFNPVTRDNHQNTIEKFRDVEIREAISRYFRLLSLVAQARDEFNTLVVQESRPFLLTEQNIFDNDKVFDYNDRTFPPRKRVSTIDTTKLKAAMKHAYFEPVLSQLRMSMGFYLISLEGSIEENHRLIRNLESKLE